ncbi:Transcription regulatory protein SNF2 [Hypsizygus marmoreus]|uniref:Transcription regulatory protein SNF2 n=1 Tax=Hypsizygus marmoreus TaxID=39966 RepID=A0A369JJU3_HYPMA|nr:Transcription regulatory protein SNF2 [Hypsizygus marmoreus]
MPSHTAASALVKLYSSKGTPWEWSNWQDITKIRQGLFPDDDKNLPPGWTRKNAIDVQSYFRAYHQLPSEEKKIAFATNSKASAYPGREFWNAWVCRHWNSWGIHNFVVGELREWNVHPLNILIREHHDVNVVWPTSDFYIPMILDSLAMKLFGEEAFPDGSDVLTTELRKCLQIIAQRSWSTIRKQVGAMKSRRNEIEATALAAFKDLEGGKPTKAKVSRAIRAVAKWKECAELFHTDENIKKADDMLAELQVIMEGLGAKLKKPVKPVEPKGICKVSEADLKSLATEEDVTNILNLYHEYFDEDAEDEDAPPISDALPAQQQLNDCGGDFGMEVEAEMSLVTLLFNLGFKTGLPMVFNTLRDRSGLSPWDDPTPFADPNPDPMPENFSKMRLHWHQLAGTHSIVRSVFTKGSNPHTTGVLVGDEVGLGKTAQAITLIAFLNQVIWLQSETTRKPPRMLADRQYLGESVKVPSLPHLIVCPGTLVAQWVSELKILLRPKSVDIFVYDSQTNGKYFWGPSGPLRLSNHLPHNRIVVVSHSRAKQALFKELNDNHSASKKKRKDRRPWDIPPTKRSLDRTIFGQTFLTAVVDEAHHMRNMGRKHAAALRVLQQSSVRIIMTATPLHTSSKDIASMGRLVGIPYFFTEASYIEEKSDAAAVRRAKKLDDDGEALLAEQLRAVKRLQGYCLGHFLRRTTESRDFEGKVLLPLPPYIEILGVLTLTERETKIVQTRAEDAKAAVESSSSSTRIQTKKFYLEYRTAVGYAKENPADLWPSFKTLEEWEPVKSTKMDVCAQICSHYLTHDDVEDVAFVEGKPVFPEIVAIPGKEVLKTRRIIIYSEFSSMAPLLQNVLRLYGIASLAINGKVTFDKVFIFSSVGSAGLNLAVADVVIFFDQPWSAQDERQIRGRAYRQPQKKIVKVIHLLANDSADLLMNDVARAKRDMFDVFVNKELGEDLRQLLKGCIPDDLDDTNEEAESKPSRKKSKKPKQPVVVDEDELDELPATSEQDSSMLTSDGEGLSDGPTSTMSDSVHDQDAVSEPEIEVLGPKEAGPEQPKMKHPPMFTDDEDDGELPVVSGREGDVVMEDARLKRPSTSRTESSNALSSLDMYPSSPEIPSGAAGDRSPPTKRPRQGTVGEESRAQILASPTHPQAAVPVIPPRRISRWEDDTSSKTTDDTSSKTTMPSMSPGTIVPGAPASKGAEETQEKDSSSTTTMPPLSSEPTRRTFLAPRPEPAPGVSTSKRPNPFAPKPGSEPAGCANAPQQTYTTRRPNPFAPKPSEPVAGSSSAPRPTTSATPNPSVRNPAPPGVPSRQPGRLDEVAAPPKSALMGFRPTRKTKKP